MNLSRRALLSGGAALAAMAMLPRPVRAVTRRERWPVPSGSTYFATLTSSASTHTKGAYTELAAATGFDAVLDSFVVWAGNAGAFLVDVAIGAGGSEQIVMPDHLLVEGTSAVTDLPSVRVVPCGITIPAGARLAARCSSNGSAKQMNIYAQLVSRGASPALTRAETYGTSLATTRGTSVDPGGSANTKGNYVQLTAASSFHARRWIVVIGNQGNNAPAGAQWCIDLAVGGDGSEQVIVPDLLTLSTPEDTGISYLPSVYACDVRVPAGSRIAVRAMCTITDATDRLIDVAVTALTE